MFFWLWPRTFCPEGNLILFILKSCAKTEDTGERGRGWSTKQCQSSTPKDFVSIKYIPLKNFLIKHDCLLTQGYFSFLIKAKEFNDSFLLPQTCHQNLKISLSCFPKNLVSVSNGMAVNLPDLTSLWCWVVPIHGHDISVTLFRSYVLLFNWIICSVKFFTCFVRFLSRWFIIVIENLIVLITLLLGHCQYLEAMLIFSILDLHCSCTKLPCCTHISSNVVCRQSWLFCVKCHVVPVMLSLSCLVSSFLILTLIVYFCLLCAVWGHLDCSGPPCLLLGGGAFSIHR